MMENREAPPERSPLKRPLSKKREGGFCRRGDCPPERNYRIVQLVVCVALAALVISQYAEVTELNVEIQKVEEETKRIQEIKRQLEAEKNMLSSGERIRRLREMKGMVPAENVKPFPSSGDRKNLSEQADRDKQG